MIIFASVSVPSYSTLAFESEIPLLSQIVNCVQYDFAPSFDGVEEIDGL